MISPPSARRQTGYTGTPSSTRETCACDFPELFPSPPLPRPLDESRRPESLDSEAGFVDLFMRGTSCAICRGREIGGRGIGGRARGVTGLGGFVKAMHCKELTTTIPFLSPSCLPPPLFLTSLSLSPLVARLSLSFPLFDSSSLHLVLVTLLSSFLFRLSFSLGALFPPLFLLITLSFSFSFYDFLSVPLALSLLPLSSSLSAPICLSFGRSVSLLPSYLFLSLPPSRSRRARWGALATCASLVNNRPDSSRSSTQGISLARVIQGSFFLLKSISLAAILKSGNEIERDRYADMFLEHPACT